MMRPQFNLIDEPWIPCLRWDDQPVELSLRDVLLKSHELRELGGESPLVTAALYRLLLAVLHRVHGPEGYDAWGQLWQAGRWEPEPLEAYLHEWRDRFDLFHPTYPFYQADAPVQTKSIVSLMPDVAANNPTLFEHQTEDEGLKFTPSQAARALVVAQTFSLAGGKSGLEKNFTDAPWARGVVFLVQGDILFETLMFNLLRYPHDPVMPSTSKDRPTWEMDDPYIPRDQPFGYLDYLTWHSRKIRLYPEFIRGESVVTIMKFTQGMILPKSLPDPMKHYSKRSKRDAPVLQRFDEDRALWRDSATLFRLREGGHRPPLVFDWLASLVFDGYIDTHQTYRILALGMAANKAKVEFYRREQLPLPLDYLQNPGLVGLLESALKMAQDAAGQIWGATRTLAKLLLSPETDQEGAQQPDPDEVNRLTTSWGIERHYWSRLELPFRRTMETLPEDEEAGLTVWQEELRRTARSAFEQITNNLGDSPRSYKAVVRSRGQLEGGLARVLLSDAKSDVPET